MEENVTSEENIDNNVNDTTETEVEPNGNLQGEKKFRYQSIEEAEKAKNETDKELARFANFTALLTDDNAKDKIEALYELHPEEVDRFYKRIYKKTYSEERENLIDEKVEEDLSEIKEKNPDLYEVKKELLELKKQLNVNSDNSKKATLENFVSKHEGVDLDELSSALEVVSERLPLEERLDKAFKILIGEGKVNSINDLAYKDAYKKQSASIVGFGTGGRANAIKEKTEFEKLEDKFMNPETLPPSFRKS